MAVAIVATMTRLEFDHLYRETHDWESSVEFWARLGFRFVEQWGEPPHRAGRLARDGTWLVLAETVLGREPSAVPFLVTDSLEEIADATNTVAESTHWGTTMVTLTDPDGRTYHIEQEERA